MFPIGEQNVDASAQDKIFEKANRSANVILAATAVASFGVWSYCIYYYVWTGIRQFNSALDIALFLSLPPAVVLLALAALRLSPARKISATLIWSSTLASIYALEALFALRPSLLGGTVFDAATGNNKHERRQTAASFGVKFDTRDLIEVLIDAKARGVDAVPAVFPAALLEQQPGTKPRRGSTNGGKSKNTDHRSPCNLPISWRSIVPLSFSPFRPLQSSRQSGHR
jgi:hypothetical protein